MPRSECRIFILPCATLRCPIVKCMRKEIGKNYYPLRLLASNRSWHLCARDYMCVYVFVLMLALPLTSPLVAPRASSHGNVALCAQTCYKRRSRARTHTMHAIRSGTVTEVKSVDEKSLWFISVAIPLPVTVARAIHHTQRPSPIVDRDCGGRRQALCLGTKTPWAVSGRKVIRPCGSNRYDVNAANAECRTRCCAVCVCVYASAPLL